ncbi:hypothetical protein BP6252_11155 [Coleophoma cylindrospora]|uniref:Major facilitator superfamily (MFS) profile domain-containing protein n=1 Tax=Coleophoma cylindrospora TaxID=1849047 RepID=A0A3D8QPP5_9HELO|nr:hypothetical protein BP6252_11155 [Coleophoma cylindrospora]
MDFIRRRLPAPRQAMAIKESKNASSTSTTPAYEPSRISQLAKESLPWYKVASRRRLYFILFPGAIVSYMTSGYDGSMMNSLQTVSYWDDYFGKPRGSKLGLISAIIALGAMCSAPFAPMVADRYGRRWGVTVGSIIMIAGAILQCESKNFAMFVVSRFILGFGLTFCTTASPSLVSELSHPRERVAVTALCNTCWFLGAIAAAWITYGTRLIPSTWSWRIPSLLQMGPSIIQLSAIWFLPESPRWLISHDRGEEAKAALIKYHGDGVETELVKLEYEEICAAISLEKELGNTTWMSMISSSGNRYRLFIIVCMGTFSQWSGNGLISYYLARILDTIGIHDSSTQSLINGIINIWNWVIAASAALLVERMGRRTLFRVSTIGMLVIFTTWTVCSAVYSEMHSHAAATAVLVFIFIFQFFYCIAFSPLPVAYSVEILSYSVRAKGMAAYVFSTKVAVFVNQYVNPIGLANIGWKYYFVYVVILAIESFIAYGWFVETKGRALEEIAVLFDGEQADVQVLAKADNEGIHVENREFAVPNKV